jgi:succinate-semialdehyde dehydrogenase/glutarate-semialdehyde dehydrogenase
MYTSKSPATGEVHATYSTLTPDALDEAVARSAAAFPKWRDASLAHRVSVLRRAAELAREREEELSQIATFEMGKPIKQARTEITRLFQNILDYYADNASDLLKDQPLFPSSGDSVVVKTVPIGPVLGIMPWNFPYYQVIRFAAPNLLLGNTVLIKHAANCPQSALALERIFHDAGLPQDAYINIFANHRDLESVIADPRVQGVSLTGSEKAGAAVGALAGQHLKKVVLELGGSDPFIVLDDHDLDRVVQQAVAARIGNGGQACVAAKRFIIVENTYDAFATKFAAAMSAVVPGDPTSESTVLGPLVSTQARQEIQLIVDQAVASGATLLTGENEQESSGAYMPPVVLSNVKPGMRAWGEEIFGPVAVLYRVEDAEEAVRLANNTIYGLAASVWSGDHELAEKVALKLDVGMVGINATAGTEPELPFGGVKASGFGRELGEFGLNEFANKKLVRTARARLS